MKIHSDTLGAADLHEACPDRVSIVELHDARSHQRRHAWDVYLTGTNRRHSSRWNEERQCHPRAATYAEWGWWMVALFEKDPDAVIGPYKGVDDFDTKTRYAFVDGNVPSFNPGWMAS